MPMPCRASAKPGAVFCDADGEGRVARHVGLQGIAMNYFVGSQKYELDGDWGRMPDGYEFHQVAGVAVDGSDNVYLFNRSSHQLMVFDREGNFRKAWAQTFSHPHGMHVDKEGAPRSA